MQYNISFYVYFLTESKHRSWMEESKMYRRIRDLREDSDLTQKSLADYLSCSQVCYSNYETGKRDVPSDVLIRLARFYHTSVDYLVGLTEERTPYPQKRHT